MADLKEINGRQIRNNIAYYLYEQARKERLLPDGTYEPNWKVINKKSYTEYLEDKLLHNKFINPHIRKNDNGQWEIDEANTNFNDLPEILKQEKVYEEDLDNTCSIIENYVEPKEQQLARICQQWDEKEEDYVDVPFENVPKAKQDKVLKMYNLCKEFHDAEMVYPFTVGKDLETIAKGLLELKRQNKNVLVVLDVKTARYGSEQICLYSKFDTLDDMFIKVTGKTYKEYQELKEKGQLPEEIEARLYSIDYEMANKFYKQGEAMIYPQKKKDWAKCVDTRMNDVYAGSDLPISLEIMESLKNNDFAKAKEQFYEPNLSGSAAFMIEKTLIRFSENGPKFYRWIEKDYIDENAERYLCELEAKNEQYKKELENNKNNDSREC